jgi:hypothetical protein
MPGGGVHLIGLDKWTQNDQVNNGGGFRLVQHLIVNPTPASPDRHNANTTPSPTVTMRTAPLHRRSQREQRQPGASDDRAVRGVKAPPRPGGPYHHVACCQETVRLGGMGEPQWDISGQFASPDVRRQRF